MVDEVRRDELALALELATSVEREGASPGAVSRDEAEQIARDVGISLEDFRTALAEARSSRLGRGRWLGPAALLSAEASVPGPSDSRDAARAIAEGQAGLPQITEGASEIASGVWRSSSRGSLLQVSCDPRRTRVSAAASRGLLKATTILGTTGAGGFIGGQLGALVISGLMGEVSSTVAVGIAVGGVGGLVSGFFSGVALWKASARAYQNRLYEAVDRMRDALSPDRREERANASVEDGSAAAGTE